MDGLLRRAVQRKQIAGAVILLMRQGQVGYWRAVGWRDVAAKKPMTPDTLFRIASMTKPVTSVAALMLVEQRKIRLSDPVSKYLPEFKSPKVLVLGKGEKKGTYTLVPARREITVSDLLTHTSGITYRFWNRPHLAALYRKAGVSDGLAPQTATEAENVKRLARLPLLHQPGSAWEYGLNTDVLGRVVEVASAKSLDQFFRERIFKPLGMKDKFFFVPAGKRDRLAALYTLGAEKTIVPVGAKPVTAGELVYSARFCLDGPKTYFSGGAGLVSTAGDYARFLQMLLGAGKRGGVRLLKAATVRDMTRDQVSGLKVAISDHGAGFGFGFGVAKKAPKGEKGPSAGTYSWGGIYHTFFWVDPKERMIGLLMTQVIPFNPPTLRGDFQKLAYRALEKDEG
jgi:CubicO group peptidase (beta-lactamase class C family)